MTEIKSEGKLTIITDFGKGECKVVPGVSMETVEKLKNCMNCTTQKWHLDNVPWKYADENCKDCTRAEWNFIGKEKILTDNWTMRESV